MSKLIKEQEYSLNSLNKKLIKYNLGGTEIHRIYKNRLYERYLMQGNIVRSPSIMSRLERQANALTERFMQRHKISYFI